MLRSLVKPFMSMRNFTVRLIKRLREMLRSLVKPLHFYENFNVAL